MYCQYVRVTNSRNERLLLCVEPTGEQLWMEPGVEYEARVCGPTFGAAELFIESDRLELYPWNDAEISVYRGETRVAGTRDHPSQP